MTCKPASNTADQACQHFQPGVEFDKVSFFQRRPCHSSEGKAVAKTNA